MNAAFDIDRLVREVIERLHAMGAAPASPERDEAPASDAARIEGRVVTLASIEGRLDGARRVVLPPGAVVTPAVKDELRRRGVTWEFAKTKSAANAKASPKLLLAATRGCDAAAASDDSIESVASGELDETLGRLCEAIAQRRLSGVLLTDQPIAAACWANRRDDTRAAWCVDLAAVREAVSEIDANLFILDSRRHNAFELRRLIREVTRLQLKTNN